MVYKAKSIWLCGAFKDGGIPRPEDGSCIAFGCSPAYIRERVALLAVASSSEYKVNQQSNGRFGNFQRQFVSIDGHCTRPKGKSISFCPQVPAAGMVWNRS